MQYHIIRVNNNKGFSILAVILIIAVIIGAIGTWILSGSNDIVSKNNNSLSAGVSALINDSSSIKNTYDQFILNGIDYNSIVFMPNVASNSGAMNLLDPTNGLNLPQVNKNILRYDYVTPGEGIWIYNSQNFLANVGDTGLADPTIVVNGISDAACNEINKQITGTAFKYNININNFDTSDANISNPNTTAFINFGFISSMAGVNMGCASMASNYNKNFFFRVLKAI